MDSLTQMALGASVATAISGKKHGVKAMFLGTICGTIPDLDVLFRHDTAIDNFTYHRSISHSLLFCILFTPILSYLFSLIKRLNFDFKDINLQATIFLVLLTHVLLDSLTIYGTQIFWPLPTPPVAFGSIFIIDPLYTVPLLIGVIIFRIDGKIRINNIMLAITSIYLIFGLVAKFYVQDIAAKQLGKSKKILVQSTPFNTLLWRVVAMEEGGYQVGYLSLFDKNKNIKFKSYTSNIEAIKPIENDSAVERLKWFTNGFYGVKVKNDKIVISDLRMGSEPDQYFFSFVVGKTGNPNIAVENYKIRFNNKIRQRSQIWQRIWNEDLDF